MQNFIRFFLRKRLEGYEFDRISADQRFQRFRHLGLAASVIRAYGQQHIRFKHKLEAAHELKAHLIHPLDIVKCQDYPVFLRNLGKQADYRLLNHLVSKTAALSVVTDTPVQELGKLFFLIGRQRPLHCPVLNTLSDFLKDIIPGV